LTRAKADGIIGGDLDAIAFEQSEALCREVTSDSVLDDIRRPLVSVKDVLERLSAAAGPRFCKGCDRPLSRDRRLLGNLVGTHTRYCQARCAKAAANRRAYVRRRAKRVSGY
jgi:hypothetical protein